MFAQGDCQPFDKEEWKQRQRESKAAHKTQLAKLPSIDERDRQFRQISKHSGLSNLHRSKLIDRKLSREVIEQAYQRGLIWTWSNNAQVPGVTASLPGVEGDRLRAYPSGFAIAATDNNGRILGVQIRKDADGDDKYFWVSSDKIGGSGIHLPTGEAPVGYYPPFDGKVSGDINCSEGFLKPCISAQRFGEVFIGAPGGNLHASPKLFKQYLEASSQLTGSDTVILNPDSGMLENHSVMKSYRKLGAFVESLGYTFRVRWWGQSLKTAGDVDEISLEVFQLAQLLTLREFEALSQVNQGNDSVIDDQPYEDVGDRSLTRDEWEAKFTDHTDPLAQLEEAQENDRLLSRILSRFGKGKKPRQRRERVAPIDTSTEEVYWVPGCLPEYEPGLERPTYLVNNADQQNEFVLEAIAKGWLNILNQSEPGVGKSHKLGLLNPNDLKFQIEKKDEKKTEEDGDGKSSAPSIWYLTHRSRCPSTPTIEANYKELTTRHQGLVPTGETTPMGQPVMKTVINPEFPEAGNCKFAHLFMIAGQKNIPSSEVEAASNPICQKCKHNIPRSGDSGAECANYSGAGFGFRMQRKEDMASDRLRLNPASAPAKLPSNIFAAWEELGVLAKPRVITAKIEDLNAEAAILEDHDFDLKARLHPIFKALRISLGEAPRFGINTSQFKTLPTIAALLDSLDDSERGVLIEDLGNILRPDIDEIMSGGGDGVKDSSETGEILAAAKARVERIDRALEKKSLKLAELNIQGEQIRTALALHFNLFPDQDPTLKGKRGSDEVKGIQDYRRIKIQEISLQDQISQLYAELEVSMPTVYEMESDHEVAKAAGKSRRRCEEKEAMIRLEATHTQFFYQLVLLLLCDKSGAGEFLIDAGKIILTLPNQRIPEIARAAAANLVLDATSTTEEVKVQLGVKSLLTFRVDQTPINNVQVFQISGFGKCGGDRRESTNDRLRKLHEGIREHARKILGRDDFKVAIAEHKSQREGFNAQIGHLQNSRGSNEIEGVDVFILHGLPKPNWGAIAAEYACFQEPPFSLEQFYQQKCDAEFNQEMGRPRASRYPEKQLLTYIVSEEVLPIEAIQLKAEDLCEAAAHNDVRVWRRIQRFLEESWTKVGAMPTQEVIAAALDITQSWVSKLVSRFAGGMQQLKAIIAGLLSPPDTGQIAPTEDEEFIAETMMPALAEMNDPEAIADEVNTFIKVFGWSGWARILRATKKSVRDSILISLLGEAIAA